MNGIKNHKIGTLLAGIFLLAFFPVADAAGQFTITERAPTPQNTQVSASDPIEIEFSQNIDFSTAEDGIIVHSSICGTAEMNFIEVTPNRISLSPECGFTAGEIVSVTVTSDLLAENGTPLTSPQQWRFTIQPEAGIDQFSTLQYPLGEGSEPSAIRAIDINNNQLPDLIVINSNNSEVTILENQMHITGEYRVLEAFETGIDPEAGKELTAEESSLLAATLPANSSITIADLNRNGYADVVVAATLSNQLIVLKNRADDQLEFDIELIDTGERPVEVVAADLNNNGHQDLVVAAAGSDRIVIHYNNGDGTFSDPEAISVGFVPLTFVVEDISNNGLLDIVVALTGEDRVIGLINDGSGNFTSEVLIDDLPFTPTFLHSDNLIRSNNSDQYADLVLGSSDETEIYLYQNSGGSFTFFNTLSSGSLSRPVFGIAADIEANGALDLVTSHFSSGGLLLNLNSLNGFMDQTIIGNLPGAVGITSSDFNDDGSVDFAITNQTTGMVTILFNDGSREPCLNGDDIGFGDVCIGEEVTEEFEVSNVCPLPLDVTVSIDHPAFTTELSSLDLEPFETTTIPVTFSPQERGLFEGALTLIYSRSCGVLQRAVEFELTGRGVESELNVPERVEFGEVMIGTSLEETIQIVNTGNTGVQIELAIEDDEGVFTLLSSDRFSLTPSQQVNVILAFSPEDFADYEGELIVTATSDCGVIEYRIQLTGSGVDPITELELPDLIDFGEVETGLSETIEFVVVNSGNVEIDADLLLQGDDAFTISGPQSFSIAPGNQQSIPLVFSPTETVEYNTEILVSGSSEFDDVQYTILATGVGIDPLPDLVAVEITPESISGDYMLGQPYRFDTTFRLDRDADVTDPFDLQFLVNNQEQERIRFTETLRPGDSRAVEFTHTFRNEGQNTVQFVVDPEDEIDELTTDNNMVSITINIRQGEISVSPNPFTPNNDGFNDVVDFDFSRIADTSNPVIRIFSFNGRLVHTLRNLNGSSIHWDGTDNGGNRLRPGVYLYVVEDNNGLVARGSITLAL